MSDLIPSARLATLIMWAIEVMDDMFLKFTKAIGTRCGCHPFTTIFLYIYK